MRITLLKHLFLNWRPLLPVSVLARYIALRETIFSSGIWNEDFFVQRIYFSIIWAHFATCQAKVSHILAGQGVLLRCDRRVLWRNFLPLGYWSEKLGIYESGTWFTTATLSASPNFKLHDSCMPYMACNKKNKNEHYAHYYPWVDV